MTKRPFAIFYVESNKAYFYGSNATSVLQIEIPEDTLSYMDVINRDKFNQLIQAFVTTNKIEPAPLLILFSTYATYDKEVAGKLPDEVNNDIQQFLDSVPFERVLSRIYKLQDKIRVVGVNKDLYEAIKHAFEKMHFPTVTVASLPLLQKMLPDIGQTVNLEILATRFEAIKPFSLITLEEINNPGRSKQQQDSSNAEKPNPLRLYGLIGVFVVLIGILVYMVMTTLQPAPKPIVVHPARHLMVPTPTVMPSTAVSSESGKLNISPTPEITGKSSSQ
ncbi:MAG: hypothetical protein KGJ07_02850 [Patescibacteria group bacterium]|nr:hypothetical protein [Patescibacteria group bacterium]MDE2588235.1 hypothetical protein [Patescibacteria group bacterium]